MMNIKQEIKLYAKDYLFDYLLGDMEEYKPELDKLGLDTDKFHWEEFTTCYGNFIHFRHKITGEVL